MRQKKKWQKRELSRTIVIHCVNAMTAVLVWAVLLKTAGAAFGWAVELSDVAQRIDAGAFRDCVRLWKISIPASCTYIDATALPDNGHLTIVCPAGSYAETFAAENGYHCITQ